MNQLLNEWLENIPKVDLHRHLTATITPVTYQKLQEKYDIANRTDQTSYAKLLSNFSTSEEFFKTHTNVRKSIRELEDFALIAQALVNQLENDKVIYSELLFSPQFFVNKDFSLDEILETLYSEFRIAKVTINLLIEFSRSRGSTSVKGVFNDLLPLLDTKYGQLVKGISLGGDEVNYRASPFKEVFAMAQKHNLQTTAHAGEWMGPDSIWEVLNSLHVDRIIHGIQSIKDEQLIHYLQRTNIPVDVSISSNYATGAVSRSSVHPITKLLDEKVNVLLSTDIPGYLGISLSSEYKKLATMGVSREKIIRIIQNTISASFALIEEKEELLRKVEKETQ